MEILVTGASGFLGQRLCKYMAERGHSVDGITALTCDLTKEENMYKTLAKKSYDVIYHLAAWTRAGDFCLTHQGQQWLINQKINTNVLSWWKDCQPQAKMIAMGTSCAYDPSMELKEENFMKGTPIDSLFSYAMTKRMLYAGLVALNKQYGLKYMCFVPSTLYGPTYHTDGRPMHFIFDLTRKIVRGKRFGEPVILWGDGYQSREIVHVDDFICAMDAFSTRENDIINIGTGTEHTIRDFARLICKKVGYDARRIKYDTTKYVGAKSKCLDVSKMNAYLPGFAEVSTPLEIGIEQLVDWISAHEVK